MILFICILLAAGFWFGGVFGGIVVGLLLVICGLLYFISEQLGRTNRES